jgi:hypothetical protein
MTRRLAHHPDVISTTLPNGEMVLLHLDAKQYYTLNDTGARIWELIGKDLPLAEIAARIESIFDVTPDRAQNSVERLVADLLVQKLLIERED